MGEYGQHAHVILEDPPSTKPLWLSQNMVVFQHIRKAVFPLITLKVTVVYRKV